FLILTGGPLTKRRMFAVGLLLGTAACVSLKTLLLVFTLLLAGGATWTFSFKQRSWRDAARIVLPALIGLVIVPAVIAFTFVKLGAWHDLVYCNFTFNELVSRTRHHQNFLRALYFPALILIFYAARDRAEKIDFDRNA